MRRALANSAGTSVSSSTPRRTQNERSFRAGRSGPRSMATKRSSTETSSKSELSSVDLPVARSPKITQRAAVADELRELGALTAGEGAALEEAAERRGEDAGRADLVGVHHRGVREERGASRDEVLEVGAHLRLEQAAQDLEVLARRVVDAWRARACRSPASISLMSATWTARRASSRPAAATPAARRRHGQSSRGLPPPRSRRLPASLSSHRAARSWPVSADRPPESSRRGRRAFGSRDEWYSSGMVTPTDTITARLFAGLEAQTAERRTQYSFLPAETPTVGAVFARLGLAARRHGDRPRQRCARRGRPGARARRRGVAVPASRGRVTRRLRPTTLR